MPRLVQVISGRKYTTTGQRLQDEAAVTLARLSSFPRFALGCPLENRSHVNGGWPCVGRHPYCSRASYSPLSLPGRAASHEGAQGGAAPDFGGIWWHPSLPGL